MSIPQLLSGLRVRVLRFRLETDGAFGRYGAYASDLRGAIGKALHGGPHYARLFEPDLPPVAPRGLRGGSGAPRPFRLDPPRPARLPDEGGEVLASLYSFLGGAKDLGPFIEAMREAADAGFGRPRARFRLRSWDAGEALTPREHAAERWEALTGGAEVARLRVRTLSPLRALDREEQLLPPSPAVLADALVRRAAWLSCLYGDEPPEVDVDGVVAEAGSLESQADFAAAYERVAASRRNQRQGRIQPLDGVAGAWEAWIPVDLGLLLLAGERIGAGKATSNGMGAIRLSAPVLD